MNILLIYPKKENNARGIKGLVKRIVTKNKKIRRDLIEISIQLPITWQRKIVDLNQEKLTHDSIKWADYVILKADKKQKISTVKLINECKLQEKKIIGIGDLFNEQPDNFAEIDHLILDKATLDFFVFDIENNTPRKKYGLQLLKNHIKYSSDSLLRISNYLSQNIQAFSV